MVGVTFAITAQRRGEHWNLSAEEKQAWGEALANCLRHVPMPEKHVGIAADIAALGFVAYASVVPRINADRAVLNAAQSQRPVTVGSETVLPFERPTEDIARPTIG